MFVKNIDKIVEEKLFYCKSVKLLRFLTQTHSVIYINKFLNENKKYVWVFLKTPKLDKVLTEWADNKKNGTLAFK